MTVINSSIAIKKYVDSKIASASGVSDVTLSGRTLSVTKNGTTAKYTTVDTDTVYADATTTAHGLMTAADKVKLNGIATGANKYSLPTASTTVLGGVKVGSGLAISGGVLSTSGKGLTSIELPMSFAINTWYAAAAYPRIVSVYYAGNQDFTIKIKKDSSSEAIISSVVDSTNGDGCGFVTVLIPAGYKFYAYDNRGAFDKQSKIQYANFTL